MLLGSWAQQTPYRWNKNRTLETENEKRSEEEKEEKNIQEEVLEAGGTMISTKGNNRIKKIIKKEKTEEIKS